MTGAPPYRRDPATQSFQAASNSFHSGVPGEVPHLFTISYHTVMAQDTSHKLVITFITPKIWNDHHFKPEKTT